jgi:hypothetical protein
LIDLREAKTWLMIDLETGIFRVDPEKIQPGEFPIKVKITDSANSVAEFSFTIYVEPLEIAIIEEPETKPEELEIPAAKSFAEFYEFNPAATSFIA